MNLEPPTTGLDLDKLYALTERWLDHYDGYDTLHDHDNITNAVSQLLSRTEADYLTSRHRFLYIKDGLMNLGCFFYRAYTITNTGPVFWNPLEEPWRDFRARYGEERIHCHECESPYPPRDIVRRHLDWELGF